MGGPAAAPHDPPARHGACVVCRALCRLRAVCLGGAGGGDQRFDMVAAAAHLAHRCGAGAGDRGLCGFGTIRRGAAGLDLCAGAYGERAVRARHSEMSATMRLTDSGWLRAPALARALSILNSGGEEARVVGGAARNALMGLPLSDIDIATTALPEEVVRRATAGGLRAVPTGIDHGPGTLGVRGPPFEVTTLRQDVETFGRKAKVAFGRDWKID